MFFSCGETTLATGLPRGGSAAFDEA